ncbi:mitochondrial chaperone BCS1 [Histoplasma capsulatum G186AR]|uniref:Mitochondrial chaperone BCS1 n=2 Tax=Ajellomyces capsulatus TaxID=5037 RepID=C0NPV9_AJECG|nr:mitochondrial chaperone BCS1 [Histoplasma capsulatum G186AR]EEH06969.1 mitochondrial chaperone BCS1 [Histoplasma capsulatum G186AR]
MDQASSLVGSLLNTIFPGSIFIDIFHRAPNLGLLSNVLIVGCAFVYVCIWVYDGIWKFCAVEVQIEPRSEEQEHLTTFLESRFTGCLSWRVRSEEWSGEDTPKTEWDWKTIGALRDYRFRPNTICLFLFGLSIFQFRRKEIRFEFCSEERYSLRVLGWSCKPIQRLLAEARSCHISKNKSHITIFNPGGKPVRQTKTPWHLVKGTSRRSLKSISLEAGRKEEVYNDMCSFLNAQSVYAKTERPYRRGYLFNGPPGTGKTSLALALAGKFGLDIYTLSLTGQNMTDDELQWLCSHLPRRCVLLIEDIDSAGINREKMRAIQEDGAKQNNQVSLSGLLNAIDGVSSSDGRILVMTTNCRDQLDAALIRPGRVDMEVKFTLASEEQIKSIFQHMYAHKGHTNLADMAAEFANQVPNCQYSPADIQNYLWKHSDFNCAVIEAQKQFPTKK